MMSRNIREEIANELKTNPVVLYMKGSRTMPQCGFSAATIAVLTELGVTYKDINVLADAEIREGIKAYSDWPTIPQLYVNGEFIGGCDIVRDLHAKGELANIIKKAVKP